MSSTITEPQAAVCPFDHSEFAPSDVSEASLTNIDRSGLPLWGSEEAYQMWSELKPSYYDALSMLVEATVNDVAGREVPEDVGAANFKGIFTISWELLQSSLGTVLANPDREIAEAYASATILKSIQATLVCTTHNFVEPSLYGGTYTAARLTTDFTEACLMATVKDGDADKIGELPVLVRRSIKGLHQLASANIDTNRMMGLQFLGDSGAASRLAKYLSLRSSGKSFVFDVEQYTEDYAPPEGLPEETVGCPITLTPGTLKQLFDWQLALCEREDIWRKQMEQYGLDAT